jgi:hypothetical protein
VSFQGRRHGELGSTVEVGSSGRRQQPTTTSPPTSSGVAPAKLATRRRAFDEGETLASEAVALLEPTDALDYKADTLRDLAHVRQLAGQLNGAAEAAQRALRLYEQKGNLVSADATRTLLHNLEASHGRNDS